MPDSRAKRPLLPLRRLVLPGLLLFAAVGSLSAQASWRTHADVQRARIGIDSFTVVANGNTIGWQRLAWTREAGTDGAERWVLTDETQLMQVRQRSEVQLTRALVEQRLRQEGSMGTAQMRIALDHADGRFTGSALTPAGGTAPLAIDVAASDDVIDDNALTALLPFVAWRDGLTLDVPVLASGKGTIDTWTVRVRERASVAVPAGTFNAWHLEVTGGRSVVDVAVSTTAPYRVLRVAPRGTPVAFEFAGARDGTASPR